MIFNKLLRESQLHGLSRIGESSKIVIRCVWAIILLLFFLVANSVLVQMIRRYLESPTFIVKLRSGEDVKVFPSVRYCPEVMFPDYKMDEFMESIDIPVETDRVHIRSILPQLAAVFSADVVYSITALTHLQQVLDYNSMSFETAVRRLTVSCEESIIRELKEFGVQVVKPVMHWFTKNVGLEQGLMFALNETQKHTNVDTTYKWVAMEQGQMYADTSINGTPVWPNREFRLGFFARIFKSTDEVKGMSESLRKCRNRLEEPLEYFPVYERRYCLLECEMRKSLRECGCLRPTHPRPPGKAHCRSRNFACVRRVRVSEIDDRGCYCPVACSSEVLDIITTNTVMKSDALTYDTFYDGLDVESVSVIRAYIIKHQGKVFARKTYFTLFDLFSQSGGIFSVYFGCSVLTILEIIMLTWHGVRKLTSTAKHTKKKKKAQIKHRITWKFNRRTLIPYAN